MKRVALALLVSSLAAPVAAQVSPIPSKEDPRLQTVVYRPGAPIRLVSFPDSSLKLVFHSGESITRAVLSDGSAFTAAVVGYGDTIELVPSRKAASATLRVETNQRQYEFLVETGEGLAAAFTVRFVPDPKEAKVETGPIANAERAEYRLTGDRVVRPDTIFDDGVRTFLQWQADRALPAVFGVGASGDEEIVAGHMRDEYFVIDRVYPQLIFRIDGEKAKATRRTERN